MGNNRMSVRKYMDDYTRRTLRDNYPAIWELVDIVETALVLGKFREYLFALGRLYEAAKMESRSPIPSRVMHLVTEAFASDPYPFYSSDHEL